MSLKRLYAERDLRLFGVCQQYPNVLWDSFERIMGLQQQSITMMRAMLTLMDYVCSGPPLETIEKRTTLGCP
jgi:hypothetical protein